MTVLQTGDQTGDADLDIRLMMVDQANATQLLATVAVLQVAGAEALMLTANVLAALTTGGVSSTFTSVCSKLSVK